MNRNERRQSGKGAIELVEEATHLLRLLPSSLLLAYYAGSIPFVLGFLYFWADMSRSAFAYRHAAEAAFYMSLLFLWMKCWHSVFASRLKAHIGGRAGSRWTLSRIMRMIVFQTFVQPSGLFILPAALIATVPFGWAYAFYQNFSLCGDGEAGGIKAAGRKAWRQANLFPKQNHLVLFVLTTLGFFVFLNLALVIYLIPQLLNTLLGMETLFARAQWSMLNTTFLAVTCGLAYLLLDPLIKTVYVLRCFYGEALHTGEDLMVELTYPVPSGEKAIT